MTVELMIENGNQGYYPSVEEGIELTLERKGQAGKLTFSVVDDGILDVQEGNVARLTVDGVDMFYGFVFTKKRDKNSTIQITAYDQLRYLVKNKDTLTYEGKKASELVTMIAANYRLNCGTIEDTGFVIESGVEQNQTLMDMIQSALDQTLRNTKNLYVLYDEFGKLTLKNIENMKVGLLIDADTAENFDYESSIDKETFNSIKLLYKDEKTGKAEIISELDIKNINQWGVLQYFEEISTLTGAAEKANNLLKMYNQQTRTLAISNAFGHLQVRAGTYVCISLDFGDKQINTFMVVNSVKHRFEENQHLMDLTLIGGDFIA